MRGTVLTCSIVNTIAENGFVIPLEREIAINAGSLHAKARKKNKNVSLADCIIAETAKKYNAIVLTMDHHFKILGNAIILER
ncbi:PIN domain-containing protein [Thermococcus sp.]|uniref:PIN domain-containing protein n=1 Tax=Thermococcus sp. TaxID=35749 RepID=UPI002608FE5D|nr:PIN domain-containing protein [Thermococcus sp.]